MENKQHFSLRIQQKFFNFPTSATRQKLARSAEITSVDIGTKKWLKRNLLMA
jgi:hypothetical protein